MAETKVTFEQDGKKAIIVLKHEDGIINVSYKWEPEMDIENPQEKDVFAVKFMEVLRNCEGKLL